MANIVKVEVENFRGIKNLFFDIPRESKLVCFVGRGDSCKTTILDAISLALSPVWNVSFKDTDFYACNPKNPVSIRITLANLPSALLSESKYGLYKRFMNRDTAIIHDDIMAASSEDLEVLTINLSVGRDLEPSWVVMTNRELEDKLISALDRSKLNTFLVSDYIDKHFTWGKGAPLYSLLKGLDSDEESNATSILNEAVRSMQKSLDTSSFSGIEEISKTVAKKARFSGIDLSELTTELDVKDLFLKEGKLSLHNDGIPIRMMGKGSKRLISICIQLELSKDGGVVLIDELEQGLEPDRIKLLSRLLKENEMSQVFLTTHSREVITELETKDIYVVHRDNMNGSVKVKDLPHDKESLQKAIRACSEAFFAKKVIVCEGATEVGICRALEVHRKSNQKTPLAFENVGYVDGTGNSLIERAEEIFESGILVCLLCDSDEKTVQSLKSSLQGKGINIVDCASGNSIEQQVFKDLPWNAIVELIERVQSYFGMTSSVMDEKIESKYIGEEFPEKWRDKESIDLRHALSEASVVKRKEWFKHVSAGQMLGELIFEYLDDLKDTSLGSYLVELDKWVDL